MNNNRFQIKDEDRGLGLEGKRISTMHSFIFGE